MNHDTEKQEIEKLLTGAGFKRNSGDLHEYGHACQCVMKGRIQSMDEYNRKIKIICEFLGC